MRGKWERTVTEKNNKKICGKYQCREYVLY